MAYPSVGVLPRWRNALISKKAIIQSTTHFASFHSSSPNFEKWKSKGKNNTEERRAQQPTKNHIRYEVRQKRSDAKKALKDLLYNNGSSKVSFEEAFPETGGRWGTEQGDRGDKKGRLKSSGRHANKEKIARRRLRKEKKIDDTDESPNMFREFGNTWHTWASKFCDGASFRSSTTGFEWREEPKWSKSKLNESDIESETESDEEQSCVIGKYSDRTVLGLPATGPLKIDDVKTAFRSAALRWHPDRHQGPSQAKAEEKFKECVNAYKSLCDAFSAA